MLKNGANPNARNKDSKLTALHIATTKDYEKIVQYLLEKGADLNAKTEYGELTALHIASSRGNEKIVEYLLEKDADPNAKDKNEWIPLFMAAHFGHEKIVQILLKKTNATTQQKWIALNIAMARGCKKITEILVENGAIDVNTMLPYLKKGEEQMINFLEEMDSMSKAVEWYIKHPDKLREEFTKCKNKTVQNKHCAIVQQAYERVSKKS